MPRINNAKAIDAIRDRTPFDNNSSTLGGGSSFKGWGDVPAEYRLGNPDRDVAYWIYSYDTPIAWVFALDGEAFMPPVRYSLTTSDHQRIAAAALGVDFHVEKSLMKGGDKAARYGSRKGW